MKAGHTLKIVVLVLIGLYFSSYAKALTNEWVRHDPKYRGVIIFVHGVTGDGRGTWTSDSGTYWPEMLTQDHDFDGQNIYVYHYESPKLGEALTIDELADNMRAVLSADGVLNEDQLIFVSHSMGGIVTREFVLNNRNYAPRIRFLYFFGTPTTGSAYGHLLDWLSNNPQFGQMLPIKQQGDTLLRRLVSEWASAMFSFPSYCAYETKTYYGQTIVDMPSAVALCNRPLTPIGENHPNMVKPSSRRSDSYLALQEAFDQTKPQLHGPDDKIQTALRSGPGQPKPKPAQTESLAARTIHLSDEIVGWQNKQAVYAPHSVAERDQFLKEIADYHQLFDSKVNAAVVELETCQVDAAKIKAEGTWVTDSAHSLIGTLGVAMAIKAAANAIPEGQPKCGTGQPTKGFGIQQNGQYWLTVGLSSLGPYKSDLQKGRSSAVGHKLGDYSSSISFYLQGDVLCVDATIFRAPNVPLLDVICNKVNAPPGWDTNFTEKAVEVVTEQEIPMFQIIFADDHHVRVNGVIPSGMNRYIVYSPEGATKITIDPTNPSPVNINIKRLFEYPAWQHRGEYAK